MVRSASLVNIGLSSNPHGVCFIQFGQKHADEQLDRGYFVGLWLWPSWAASSSPGVLACLLAAPGSVLRGKANLLAMVNRCATPEQLSTTSEESSGKLRCWPRISHKGRGHEMVCEVYFTIIPVSSLDRLTSHKCG